MTTQEIEKYLEALNGELSRMGVKGEICLFLDQFAWFENFG